MRRGTEKKTNQDDDMSYAVDGLSSLLEKGDLQRSQSKSFQIVASTSGIFTPFTPETAKLLEMGYGLKFTKHLEKHCHLAGMIMWRLLGQKLLSQNF